MQLPLYQVDAFAGRLFAGNPAAVCPLDRWLPDQTMQAIAAENNLSETAFFVPAADGFDLRWFTPAVETDLCGHATLASGFVVMTALSPDKSAVRFHTKSGPLEVTRQGDRFSLSLPAQPGQLCPVPPGLAEALGRAPRQMLAAQKYLAIFDDEVDVAAIEPDLAVIAELDRDGLIISAPGREVDFVSRYFAPHAGIPEDPVTGSAHCTLVPYWSQRLGKKQLTARQISRRGGELACEDRGDRVVLAGRAVLYLEGRIHV
jgi:PhzF family phenazine biosynthesis protein